MISYKRLGKALLKIIYTIGVVAGLTTLGHFFPKVFWALIFTFTGLFVIIGVYLDTPE